MQLEKNGSALLSIRRETGITVEEVINKFAVQRRHFFYVSKNFIINEIPLKKISSFHFKIKYWKTLKNNSIKYKWRITR